MIVPRLYQRLAVRERLLDVTFAVVGRPEGVEAFVLHRRDVANGETARPFIVLAPEIGYVDVQAAATPVNGKVSSRADASSRTARIDGSATWGRATDRATVADPRTDIATIQNSASILLQ